MADQESGMTLWLFFSISICVFGNSFLYGYNIGAVNSPARLIKAFYSQVYLARQGIETVYNPLEKSLYYTEKYFNTTRTDSEVSTARVATLTPGLLDNANMTTTIRPALLARNEEEIEADNFIEIMWSLTVALFVFFGMIGAFSSGRIADYFGRKRGMVLITFIQILAGIFGGIPTFAKAPECLMVSRVLVGLHSGINISLAALYLAEIAPTKIRGAVGTCHQLFITVGILFSMVLGLPELAGRWSTWPIVFAFNAVPSIICLIFFPFCPESPRFLLIKKNDEAGARQALKKLRGHDFINDEMEEMRIEARKASAVKNFSLKELLTTPDLKLPVIIACFLQVAQQWSGINAAMSYSSFIFSQANVPSATIPYVIVGQGAINVISSIFAVPLMEKLGRRPLLIFPMGVMVVSFIVLTVCLNLLQLDAFSEQKMTLAIVCIIVVHTYVIGFALGLGPIPFLIGGEIFRQAPRAAAMSLSLAFNWVCNFILMLTFRFIQKGIGAYTYLIFIVILVIAIIFIVIFVPETKNKTFDEIAQSIAFGRASRSGGLAVQRDEEEMKPMRRKSKD
ncbi:solute carrier family 2, facilitated glucose transporter member 1-like [Dreissena polymorpha]|uniref:Major facilitator superfamily (MFS) profile domain-containing protein n=1 Tax=Dreissena polymorpha TaxID=45954 RepID=A0A9D4GJD3_DREPO|nr:solute carrier family 2, facilitated glucose transporter member 1-like [Dreissena polymorpha]XP_052286770.1 solute carrier family 2, facilitated glucose transporter member 1-like [Dreissena polymorpha]XP_052286772.1 solute carrier family 2, facilitated glucose transporter member 1-like [Dreissena polymorpha]XP_052286773.1 solute carrier family 2, facilitated glucose transporter member 1-like [Dreissena polymorpha]XP_052286774.1 solute carrier family 2, facilitated glucose transporter member 